MSQSSSPPDVSDLLQALDLTNTCLRSFDGTIQFWSEGDVRLYGWSAEEAIGRISHELLRTEFPVPLAEIEAELLRAGSWTGELLHCAKNGRRLWVASQWVVKSDADGTPRFVIEVNNDISDNIRGQEVSRYLAAIVESSDDAIVGKTLTGIVTSWNPGAERLFGYTASEMIGHSILRLFPSELASEENIILARIGRGERIHHYETVRVSKDGRRIAVSLAISPVRDRNGRVIGASKIARDVSDRKKLEEAVRRGEERQRLAVEAGQIGLWSYDLSLELVHLTQHCRTILGLPPETSVADSQTILSLLHPEDAPVFQSALQSSLTDGQPFRIDFRVLGPSREVRWVQCVASPSLDSHGKVSEVNGTMVDFTARKNSEDALLRSNAQLQQFAYAAAHDLQEPLRNVALCVELAKATMSPPPHGEAASLLTFAVDNAHQMQAMVRDLLAYSRVIHETQTSDETSDAQEVLNLALANLASSIEEAAPEITWDPLPRVAMPKTHLLQIFQNLVGNSIKHRGSEPLKIHIGARITGDLCEFSVKDNGIGIEPQFQQRVFDVFKRLRKKETSGTGVGLALCKRIVELYGGEIWVQSDGKSGTTFFFQVQLPAGAI